MYCVYNNKEFDEKQMTKDHIIPLSLGGCDQFYVMAEKNTNNIIGTKIESKISNDKIIKIYRERSNTLGHSKKKIYSEFKTVGDNNEKLIFSYDEGTFRMIDPISKNEVRLPKKFSIENKIDIFAYTKFLAKIALGTGFFLFKEDFLRTQCCNELRDVVMGNEDINSEKMYYNIRFCENFEKIDFVKKYDEFCKLIGNSLITIKAMPNFILFLIGICGMEFGNVVIKNSIKNIGEEYMNPLGVTIICDNKNNELYINDTEKMLRENFEKD